MRCLICNAFILLRLRRFPGGGGRRHARTFSGAGPSVGALVGELPDVADCYATDIHPFADGAGRIQACTI